jgi:hypothetical protein
MGIAEAVLMVETALLLKPSLLFYDRVMTCGCHKVVILAVFPI